MNTKTAIPYEPPRTPLQPPMVYVRERLAWEYKQLTRNISEEGAPRAEELNSIGAEGWELVGVFADAGVAYFYFKRTAGK